ncbi:tRNA A64-2'-O-ribosylphosphate transferase [Delphinella strobiligena]|nr:tRNA A64-2'-O-ribosylphosphate transferase [Delphinella strobiligena]
MTQSLQLSDLIFSDAKTDFNKVLGDLKRSTLSLKNRFRSIEQDARFAASVAEAYQVPLVANERCGSWYIPPAKKSGSAYFKSTDGHMSQWSFSLRRLNLQVLEIVSSHGGCAIVDSTRRGKSMPDALSKTIPVWTCVMNRVLFPDQPECHELRTPPTVVGASEHAQIASRIPDFVDALRSLKLDLNTVKAQLTKPLRPIWVTQESSIPTEPPEFSEFYPIICCTSSRRVPGGEASEGGYIQGAGDDAESWAHGLTAPLFWANQDALMQHSEEELPSIIEQMVNEAGVGGSGDATLVKPTKFLYISTMDHAETAAQNGAFDFVVTVAQKASKPLELKLKERYLNLSCVPGKVGSRQLRLELNKVPTFLFTQLLKVQGTRDQPISILVACATGKDHSIGVGLALLCLLASDDGRLRDVASIDKNNPASGLSKQIIKQRLSWISVSLPDANPSRATLQSVNAFLLG